MKINSIIDLVKDLDTSRQTKNLNKLLIRILLHLQVEFSSEEIDFGAYTWGRGTIMTFNARNQGTIGSYGDPNYLLFRWNWVSGAYNLMELEFYDGGSMAYIEGAMADSYSFSGTWYNSWREYQDNIHGQPFRMRRQ